CRGGRNSASPGTRLRRPRPARSTYRRISVRPSHCRGLRARGRVVRVIELTGGRPKANAAVLAGVADGTETVVDGLALANLGEVVAAQARRLPVVAFVHGPLAQESGLPPAEAKRAAQREAALLSRLRGVLCPSRKTA